MQTRFFLCCPLCSRRLPKGWLGRAVVSYRRWGYALAYLGRRQIQKVGELLVGATPPQEAKRWVGEDAEALAALAAVLLYELAAAGWRPAYLRLLGIELVRQRIVEPVVAYVDHATPPAQYVGTAQPAGPARWESIDTRPAAPRSAPAGNVRWEDLKP